MGVTILTWFTVLTASSQVARVILNSTDTSADVCGQYNTAFATASNHQSTELALTVRAMPSDKFPVLVCAARSGLFGHAEAAWLG